MNKKYIYIDGKVIIEDENRNKRVMDYSDNLDDVLIQENLIETMENRIEELEKESKSYQKKNKKPFIPINFLITAPLATIGVPIIFYLMGHTDIFISTVNTFFGPMNEALYIGCCYSTMFLPIITFIEFGMYKEYKDAIKKEKGINSEFEFLKQEIVRQKEKLINLRKEKTRDKENKEFRVAEVNDLQQLKEIKNLLNLYFELGYDEEKYYKYYEQGKLDTKLKKYYNDSEIEAAKEYLEAKGPTLARKKH